MTICVIFCLQATKDCSLSSPLHGDCSRAVEANEKIGVALWLRCRLALFRSLAAQIPDATALSPGLVVCWTSFSIHRLVLDVHLKNT